MDDRLLALAREARGFIENEADLAPDLFIDKCVIAARRDGHFIGSITVELRPFGDEPLPVTIDFHGGDTNEFMATARTVDECVGVPGHVRTDTIWRKLDLRLKWLEAMERGSEKAIALAGRKED